MKKKLKLDLDFSSDYVVAGISCLKKDYWLAYQINHHLGFNFVRQDDFKSYNESIKSEVNFSFFEYIAEETEAKYFLISNKNSESRLIPVLKNIDYFFIGEKDQAASITEFLTAFRSIKGILLAQTVDTSKQKIFKPFFLDLELRQ